MQNFTLTFLSSKFFNLSIFMYFKKSCHLSRPFPHGLLYQLVLPFHPTHLKLLGFFYTETSVSGIQRHLVSFWCKCNSLKKIFGWNGMTTGQKVLVVYPSLRPLCFLHFHLYTITEIYQYFRYGFRTWIAQRRSLDCFWPTDGKTRFEVSTFLDIWYFFKREDFL